jgi:hypothetical protein
MSEKHRYIRPERRGSVATALAAVVLVVFPGPTALDRRPVAPLEVFIPHRSKSFIQASSLHKGRV